MNVFKDIKPPKVIFETDSKYNGHIQIIEVGHTRKLAVDGVIQSVNWDSPSINSLVWGNMADLIEEQVPNATNLLMFGLGGGSMQHLLSQKMPQLSIVSVEIDPIMVEVAKNYFDLDKIQNHKVIVEDALRAIVEPEKHGLEYGTFDVIVVDIYCGEKYPDLGKSGNFLANLKKLAAGGGLVVFNRIYVTHHQEEVNVFIESLSEFFTSVEIKTVAGKTNSDNVLIYCRA